ncbi:MAG: sigma-70 family RNA polymerase sigma factor, partial [Acidobacteria bacterium]|nr:sigma-70 family RNA polymerase sigma factor [Acidobacteriota bacterium]
MKRKQNRRQKTQFLEEAMPQMSSLYRVSFNLSRDRDLAEDLVQETYKEAWQSFHRYTPGTDCKAWLFRIFFRVWQKHLRQVYRFSSVDMEDVSEDLLVQMPDAEQKMESEEVMTILRSLPTHYQTVLVLADVEEFRYREIAQMLELPIGTVMSRLNRARSLFRTKFVQETRNT